MFLLFLIRKIRVCTEFDYKVVAVVKTRGSILSVQLMWPEEVKGMLTS